MLFHSCRPGKAEPPQRLAPAAERVRQLLAVVVADHVVAEDDEALARQADRARRVRTSIGVFSRRP